MSTVAKVIEAIDWHTMAADTDAWQPWVFESIELGYALMIKTGKASTAACLDVIMEEQEFQNQGADVTLKGTAIGFLLRLSPKDRTQVLKRVSARAKKTKGPLAKEWTRILYASLEAGRLVL